MDKKRTVEANARTSSSRIKKILANANLAYPVKSKLVGFRGFGYGISCLAKVETPQRIDDTLSMAFSRLCYHISKTPRFLGGGSLMISLSGPDYPFGEYVKKNKYKEYLQEKPPEKNIENAKNAYSIFENYVLTHFDALKLLEDAQERGMRHSLNLKPCYDFFESLELEKQLKLMCELLDSATEPGDFEKTIQSNNKHQKAFVGFLKNMTQLTALLSNALMNHLKTPEKGTTLPGIIEASKNNVDVNRHLSKILEEKGIEIYSEIETHLSGKARTAGDTMSLLIDRLAELKPAS